MGDITLRWGILDDEDPGDSGELLLKNDGGAASCAGERPNDDPASVLWDEDAPFVLL